LAAWSYGSHREQSGGFISGQNFFLPDKAIFLLKSFDVGLRLRAWRKEMSGPESRVERLVKMQLMASEGSNWELFEKEIKSGT
jgi:hypothetical protein